MKTLYKYLSSSRLMAFLMAIFTISVAIATFIENDFGTESARTTVYNAKWFELLLLLGIINIIASIFRFKLYKQEKLTLFIFHISFVLIIIGAGFTRYLGFEGTMSIREGSGSNHVITEKTYINLKLEETNIVYSFPVYFSSLSKNRFKKTLKFENERLGLNVKEVIFNAEKSIQYNDDGVPIAQFITATGQKRMSHMLQIGEELNLGMIDFVFSMKDELVDKHKVLIFENDGMLYFKSPFEVKKTIMADQSSEILQAGLVHPFLPLTLYHFKNQSVVLRNFMSSGQISAISTDTKNTKLPTAIIMEISFKNQIKEIILWGQKDVIGEPASIDLAGLKLIASYGSNVLNLPFQIKLKDFILERYPGSNSPSWYESHVELIDQEQYKKQEFHIYMNHILKHRGYRFYQASYDPDEKGTLLSVNYDWLGTLVTYLGYLLMTIGMVLSIFNRKSRFQKLAQSNSKLKSLLIIIGLAIGSALFADDSRAVEKIIPKDHADEFGKLLIQDIGGRIKPLNTLASEVLRKVSRKTQINNQNAMQVFLGMMVWPDYWQQKPIVKVGHKEIHKILGTSGGLVSFNDFFNYNGSFDYKLRYYVEEANRKKPIYRTKFDNEVIRVDERVNVLFLTYTRSLLKIFPNKADSTGKWFSPVTSIGKFSIDDSVYVNNITEYYFSEVENAIINNNWDNANELQKSFFLFQNKYGIEDLPSSSKVKLEVLYYKAEILNRLSNYYLLLGFILLLFQFLNIFFSRVPVRFPTIVVGVAVSILFILHTIDLGIRWYISGHAPWSNGYEALTFTAWATVLAGLIFSYRSGITLSTTAILAGLILLTAHLSWMDPQVTNLVPVLKSYWLIIHVAVITISYGFAGLGALLALFNLLLMFFESKRNTKRVSGDIDLLTRILEMTLTVALYLLTIGTFLGGVWANESWGRYWGWDPKETWALITIIVYAFILHMRLVPGLKGRVIFNIFGTFGFGSVIMTYFGVNYYLSGLHSYAKGDPVPLPPVVYYTVAVILVISILAAINQFQLNKLRKT